MTINPNPTVSVPAGPIAPAGYELRTVDPHALLDNPYNARRAHRDREGLAPSIGALGILLPPPGFDRSKTEGWRSSPASAASTRPSRRGCGGQRSGECGRGTARPDHGATGRPGRFDTDAEAVDRLTQTATKDSSRLGHVLAGLRRTRDDRAAYEKAARQITESGVPLDELENGWWLPAGGAWLSELFSP